MAAVIAASLITPTAVFGQSVQVTASGTSAKLAQVGHYSSGLSNEDGGVEEIVDYNEDNKKLYSVNGQSGVVDVIAIDAMTKEPVEAEHIDIKTALTDYLKGTELAGFEYGDMSSISVSENLEVAAVAIQAAQYDKNGLIVLMDYSGNIVKVIQAGVQPDMLTFAQNGQYLLAANEGEPREGYGEGTVDPKGSVTVIRINGSLENAVSSTLTFDKFDGQKDRLAKQGVLLKKDGPVSRDLEPEYITVDDSGNTAYVSLQENNAVAVVDLKTENIRNIYSLGYKDHSLAENALDLRKDGKIEIRTENVMGIRMPDTIASYQYKGRTYLVTANEGDSRDWKGYLNEVENELDGNKVIFFDKTDYIGLDQSKDYIFGGRSFAIFRVDQDQLSLVYDSGSDFERITAEVLPDMFNTSHSKIKLEDRSGKKGPEPEALTLGTDKGRTWAFVGLERIGGIMTYDITNPYAPVFQSYINTRDFSKKIAGDSAPEGLVFISGAKSPTHEPLVVSAYEVSGTVGVYSFKSSEK